MQGYEITGKVLESLIENKAIRATAYLSEKFVINMTLKRVKGNMPAKNQNSEIVLVVGKPNYEQREFIKKCKKAGEKFPVKKIQLRFPVKGKR